jgi:hypothetical protein
MEAFPVGSHVMIELADERKIAGYLAGGSIEEGVILRVTHKDSELVRRVSDVMKTAIAADLAGRGVWWLRREMIARGHFRGVLAGRSEMEAQLAWDVERDLLEDAEDGMQFRELSSPVTTYVHPGAIMLMEATADKVQEAEISLFDQTLDEALEQILTVGEAETKEEDVETEETREVAEDAGREGRTEDGSSSEDRA